ncbi:hypothetical protein EIN_327240 [Entamoeba invadens IP1]|uniref:Uncharacterized protein n=2 Tax=Entamoeba invadens IP1 TaxID=370355 RepID=A0A0A1TXH2_ENTIV|nr:hypothetical protein EIN_327240 [Entamoeba invadens IP1]ELP86077.1 hypothetical protein EIN_327240 [Entamoeba invadens IP1]|eukprot:XP_004185423.1 hypothetical protein EIN_327240 [Entamoeba invadens IP1]
MVKFIIHHNVEGTTIYFSQFYQTNIQSRKLEALMEIITAHLKTDQEREGPSPSDILRFSTYTIESQEYSVSSLKPLQEEFEGVQILYCEVGGIVITLGLHENDSVFVAQNFVTNWVSALKKLYKTNLLNNIYDKTDELLAYLDKLLPLGNLLLINQSYIEYLKTEATNLTRAM